MPTPTRPHKTICIVGVGLIGGSLGMALRKRKSGYRVIGVGRDLKKLQLAKRLGAIDNYTNQPAQAAEHADVIVICTPVDTITNIAKLMTPSCKPQAILTDVGSVKSTIVKAMRPLIKNRPDISFVGAHPIAGSEKTGVENATPTLFQNATCVITSDGANPQAVKTIQTLWEIIEARCVITSAHNHDRFLALTSHLPHLLAFALFDEINRQTKTNPIIKKLVGGSFRDMTRIAGADAGIWSGIICANRSAIIDAARQFDKRLGFFAKSEKSHLIRSLKLLSNDKKHWNS